ncbi:MAG: class I SAM-dependent methyltransferase [Lachnospiraceae bacterium]|nr:class I SAM-dependent methyltransferase [Lachnospiraceae bacterium]
MNYNIKVIRPGSTHAKFLDEIEPGSTVLECGCATGYMTRYMSEELGVKVWIVEYEKKAFDLAINYAEGGLCADLMGDEWREYFRGYKFDYIMFADVLEHVYDPKYVLQSATALLKKEGKILVSLPNIGHNDIIMSLYEDNWNYKTTGLLDETHIRFFGYKNIDKFFNEAGLSIIKKDHVFTNLGESEHRTKFNNNNAVLLDALKLRKYGNIYQFVIVAQRTDYVVTNDIKQEEMPVKPISFIGNAFYNDTMAFSGNKRIDLRLNVDGIIREQFDYTKINDKYFRYDPIEGTHCVVKGIQFEADGKVLDIESHNGVQLNGSDKIIFENDDPRIIVSVPEGTKELKISGRVIPIFTNLERELAKKAVEFDNMRLEAEREKEQIRIALENAYKLLNNCTSSEIVERAAKLEAMYEEYENAEKKEKKQLLKNYSNGVIENINVSYEETEIAKKSNEIKNVINSLKKYV